MIIITQIFCIAAMIFLFMLYQQQNRKHLLVCKLCADFFWSVHYLFLGAYGGMIPNFVGIFRELVFVNRENKKWANHIIWPLVFIILNWVPGLITYKTAVNLLPITASSCVTLSLWCKKPKITKIISVPVSIMFMIYDVFVHSWIGFINESIALSSIIFYFIKEKRNV